MIGKLIRMQGTHVSKGVPWSVERPQSVRRSVVALTTYIVDADPHALIVERAADVLSLSSYAMALDALGVEPGEKVEDFGSRNLVGTTLSAWQEQMIATATSARATAKPILHFVISLAEGEHWAEGQAEEAIDIVLQTLGLKRCAVVWSRHGNTANAHLHVCVIRVDPMSGSIAGSKWLIDDLHQALALIDERQQRARAPEALYVAREGSVYDVETDALVRDASGNYYPDWYKPHGRKRNRLPLALREAKSELIDAAEQAGSWEELHKAFAEFDAVYDRKSSGAHICRGGANVKASRVSPSLSRIKLEVRLGPFEADVSRVNAEYEAFRADLNRQLSELRARRERDKQRIRQRAAHIFGQLMHGRRSVLKELINAEANEAESVIGKVFELAIKRCTDQRRTESEWMAEGKPAYVPVSTPAVLMPAANDEPVRDFAGPTPDWEGWSTAYMDESGRALFTDHLHFILVHQSERVQAIDEALALAEQRWGSVSVQGPSDFMNIVAVRARALGIEVVDLDGRPLEHEAVDAASPVVERVAAAVATASASDAAAARPAEAEKQADRLEKKPTRDAAYEQRIVEAIERLKEAPYLPIRRIDESAQREQERSTGRLELVLDDPHGFWDQYLKFDALLDQDDRIQAHLRQSRSNVLEEVKSHLIYSKAGSFPRTYHEVHAQLPKRNYGLHRAVLLMRGDRDFEAAFGEARAIWLALEEGRQEQQRAGATLNSDLPQAQEPLLERGHNPEINAINDQLTEWDLTLAAASKRARAARVRE